MSSYPNKSMIRNEVQSFCLKCHEKKKILESELTENRPIILQMIGFKPYILYDGEHSIEAEISYLPDEDDPLKRISRNGMFFKILKWKFKFEFTSIEAKPPDIKLQVSELEEVDNLHLGFPGGIVPLVTSCEEIGSLLKKIKKIQKKELFSKYTDYMDHGRKASGKSNKSTLSNSFLDLFRPKYDHRDPLEKEQSIYIPTSNYFQKLEPESTPTSTNTPLTNTNAISSPHYKQETFNMGGITNESPSFLNEFPSSLKDPQSYINDIPMISKDSPEVTSSMGSHENKFQEFNSLKTGFTGNEKYSLAQDVSNFAKEPLPVKLKVEQIDSKKNKINSILEDDFTIANITCLLNNSQPIILEKHPFSEEILKAFENTQYFIVSDNEDPNGKGELYESYSGKTSSSSSRSHSRSRSRSSRYSSRKISKRRSQSSSKHSNKKKKKKKRNKYRHRR